MEAIDLNKKKLDEKKIFGVYCDSLSKATRNLNRFYKKEFSEIFNILKSCKERNKTAYICGNGGSSSTAEHWMNDLMKIGGMRAISLTNLAVISAYGNDISFEHIFSEQLNFLLKEGDVLIAISGSGNSKNIIKAISVARKKHAIPVAILGFEGGRIKNESSLPHIIVESKDYGIIEDIHLSLGHIFARCLKEASSY